MVADKLKKTKQAVLPNAEQWKPIIYAVVAMLVGGGGINGIYSGKIAQGEQTNVELQSQIDYLNEMVEKQEKQLDEAAALMSDLELLKSQVKGIDSTLKGEVKHEHKYGDWGGPVQLKGNFPTPQFVQHRSCVICGHSVSRMAQ